MAQLKDFPVVCSMFDHIHRDSRGMYATFIMDTPIPDQWVATIADVETQVAPFAGKFMKDVCPNTLKEYKDEGVEGTDLVLGWLAVPVNEMAASILAELGLPDDANELMNQYFDGELATALYEQAFKV